MLEVGPSSVACLGSDQITASSHKETDAAWCFCWALPRQLYMIKYFLVHVNTVSSPLLHSQIDPAPLWPVVRNSSQHKRLWPATIYIQFIIFKTSCSDGFYLPNCLLRFVIGSEIGPSARLGPCQVNTRKSLSFHFPELIFNQGSSSHPVHREGRANTQVMRHYCIYSAGLGLLLVSW